MNRRFESKMKKNKGRGLGGENAKDDGEDGNVHVHERNSRQKKKQSVEDLLKINK